MVNKIRSEIQLPPDALDTAQPFGIFVHERDRASALCEPHAVDAADACHPVDGCFENGVDVMLAYDAVEIIVEDEPFVDESETLVIVAKIFAPSRIINGF